MSEYEHKTWVDLQKQAQRRKQRRVLKPETRQKIAAASSRAGSAAKAVPGADLAQDTFMATLEGLRVVTMDAAMASVNKERVLKRYRRQSISVYSLRDIQGLDLAECDAAIPHLRLRYSSASAAQGVGASLLITGAEASATVSGGATAGVVVGAIAADIAGVLAAMGRVVAETGAYYGYDLKSEEEKLFAMAVIAYSSAATQPAKAAALAEISKLTQMMMRKATWQTLNREPLVKAIRYIYARLGLRLTKGGLSKAVPVAGAVIGGGMNAAALARVATDAKFAFRLRFLVEKYGLDPEDVTGQLNTEADDDHITFEVDWDEGEEA